MRVVLRCVAVAGLVLLGAVTSAQAARRVALVVGNARYENVSQLRNPINDAAAVAASLKSAGFDDVRLVDDLGQGQFLRALRDFATIAAGADTALVYYAGHGVEVDGRNYLVPVDATLAKAADVEFEAISLDAVRSSVSGAKALRVVILDACRNNPFKLARADGKRAVSRGLARVEPGANELVAYAAREGTTADDGSADNSPYAGALVRNLAEPGLEVRLLFGRVRDQVFAATNGSQEPFTYGTLGGDAIYLNAPAVAAQAPSVAAAAAPAAVDEAAQLWPVVEKTTSCGVLRSFVDRFAASKSAFVGFAQARMEELACQAGSRPDQPQALAAAAPKAPALASQAQPPAAVAPPQPEAASLAAPAPERSITPFVAPVGKWAEGAAFTGSALWVAESGQRTIAQITNDGAVGQRVTVGRLPVGMASMPDGRVFALVQTDKLVWQQGPGATAGRPIAKLTGCPAGLAAGEQVLWILTWPDCSSGTSRAIRLDPATGRLSQTADLGAGGQAIAVAHGKVWLAHMQGEALDVIDPVSLAAQKSSIENASLWSLAANAKALYAGGRIGADNARGLLVAIDPDTHAETHRLEVGQLVQVVAADDDTVVALGEKGTIWVASAEDLTLRSVITLDVGEYRPSSALIVDGRLIIVAQQYKGENGAVFAVRDWR